MTIEEKRLKINEHCRSKHYRGKQNCSDCELHLAGINCWRVIYGYSSVAEVEKLYNILNYDTSAVTRNLSAVSDRFFCEKCGIRLEDCTRVIFDEDAEYTTYQEYEFKFCPECGRKIVEE